MRQVRRNVSRRLLEPGQSAGPRNDSQGPSPIHQDALGRGVGYSSAVRSTTQTDKDVLSGSDRPPIGSGK